MKISVISFVAAALTCATLSSPAYAQLGGLFGGGKNGNPKIFVEQVQEVQVEYDYAPTVGRHPEPEPTPFVPVHYLTPEQRAEPIIVEPAPIYVTSGAEQSEPEAQEWSTEETYDDQQASPNEASGYQEAVSASPDNPEAPSYITSNYAPAGSATGSKAVPVYSSPDN